MTAPSTSVIVLGYGEEPLLEQCLGAIASQLRAGDEIVLVDNGVGRMAERREVIDEISDRLRIVGDGTNRGFAGGCNYAAQHATGSILVFVNSDAIIAVDALELLTRPLEDTGLGIASGSLRLADEPGAINSSGNPVNYLGITWAGGLGEPVAEHASRATITSATGGFFAIRRELWELLDGFHDEYFAYHEDTDLSLRTQMAGKRIEYIADASALHHYEFSRNPFKMYLLERNRWLVLLTDFPASVRRRVLPFAVTAELPLLLLAVLQGWGRQKVASWWWLVRNRSTVRRLRRAGADRSVLSDREFAALLTHRFPPSYGPRLLIATMDAVSRVIWWGLSRTLPDSTSLVRRSH